MKIIDAILAVLPEKSEIKVWFSSLSNTLPPRWDYSLSSLGQALLLDSTFEQVLSSISRLLLPKSYFTFRRSCLLEAELAKQLENDRLFRIMCKLNFINERQSYLFMPRLHS